MISSTTTTTVCNVQPLGALIRRLRSCPSRIAVLDDYFPWLLTGFRIAEYNWYLDAFPELLIFSAHPDFETVHAEYAATYPKHADRVRRYDQSSLNGRDFAYLNFLNNAHHFLPELERRGIPFVFTLYPGGGFGLNDPDSDAKLNRVLASPLLRCVIATQPVTVDYLAAWPAVDVRYINGGGINPMYFDRPSNRRTVPAPAAARICFVAEKYMERGANKGYPEFIAAATTLALEFPNLQFSIVGSFTSDDVPLDPAVRSRFRFLGTLPTVELKAFFQGQDLIVSPNRPFVLGPGVFDGFPTGCCVEAALCGVTIVCSDVLGLNRAYVDGEDIVICDPDPAAIVGRVRELVMDPQRLSRIGTRGRATTRAAFDPRRQLGERTALLRRYATRPSRSRGLVSRKVSSVPEDMR
jgi:lipopolysaccharide transport system ATP-binding protein